MKVKVIMLALCLAGCSSNAIHLTDADSAWVAVGGGNQFYPYWCTNKDKDGKPSNPTCYEAEIRNSSKSSRIGMFTSQSEPEVKTPFIGH